MTYSECEIVADAGLRLQAIEGALVGMAETLTAFRIPGALLAHESARAVANVRGLLASLPLEAME